MTIGCDDIILRFHSICQNQTIYYPSGPVIKPYARTVYQLSELGFSSAAPNYIAFNGQHPMRWLSRPLGFTRDTF